MADFYERNKQYTKRGAADFNTKLGGDEPKFRKWVKENKVPFDVNAPVSDYDMRGFYKALKAGDPKAASAIDPNDSRLHYPDYWKTPYHETFSNQSQWATPDAPAWNDKDQLVAKDGTVVFDDRAPKPGQEEDTPGYASGGAVEAPKDPFAEYTPPGGDTGGAPAKSADPFADYPVQGDFHQPDSAESQSGDTWKAVKAGVQSGVVGPALAGGRYLAERNGASNLATVFKNLGISSDEVADEDIKSMSPAAQKALQSSITSPDFWSSPFLAAKLKAANMAPMVAATLVPSAIAGGPVGATLMVGVANGAISAGDAAKEIYKKIDDTSDEDLQKQVPYYAGLRSMGMSEEDARTQYNQKVQGDVPLINLLVGTAAGLAGPAAGLARVAKGGEGVAGAAGRGLIGRVGLGAAEGAGVNAVQGGTENATVQQALVDNQLQGKFDTADFGRNLVDQLAMGAPLGAIGGVLSKGHGVTSKGNDVPAAKPAVPKVEVTAPATPDAAQTAAMTADAKPPAPTAPDVPDVQAGEIAPKETPNAPAPAPVADAAPAATDTAGAAPPVSPAPDPRAAPPDVARASQNLDTGQNVPESSETLALQQRQLIEGKRPAQMFPAGTPELPLPQGAGRVETDRGIFHYNPNALTPEQVKAFSAAGRENEILGLGPHSKPEVEARVAAGETPVAVTEHTPDGVEVRSAVGTDQTAPGQAKYFEATKDHPDNIVNVGAPPERVQRAARVLDAQDDAAEKVRAEAKAAQDAAKPQLIEKTEIAQEPSKDQNVTRVKARAAKEEAAKKIFDEHASDSGTVPTTEAGREELRQRLDTTIKAAEAAGINVKAIKGYEGSDRYGKTSDHMVYLKEAYDLRKTLENKGAPPKRRDAHITAFLGRERAAKGGDFSIMRNERKAEGEMAKQGKGGKADVDTIAAPAKAEQGPVRMDAEMAHEERELSNATPEKDAVETNVAKSAKIGVRGVFDEERAAKKAEVRKIAITDEERAKYNIPGKPKAEPKLPAEVTPEAKPVPPKIAAIKERVAAAARNVERAPTEAQKEAGNYPKGHVSIQGLDVTIENRKGSTRSGTDAEGKPWSVKLPDHYGYIKRTEGADGDHIDTYVGPHPDSKHVFVIDQNHIEGEKAGTFDEHKVMLGYKDAVAAMEAYERAFSDGKGHDRIGLIKPMTMDEFKGWLKHDDTKAPVAEAEPLASALTQPGREIKTAAGKSIKPLFSTTLHAALKSIKADDVSTIGGKMAVFMRQRLLEYTKNVPFHVVDEEGMKAFNPDNMFNSEGPLGMHMRSAKDNSTLYVAVRADQVTEPHELTHVVLHEAVHAATIKAMEENPAFGKALRDIMDPLYEQIIQMHDGNMPEAYAYAFKNSHEFIAEAFSNPKFQELLASIPADKDMLRRLGLDGKRPMSKWELFVGAVRTFLRRAMGGPKEAYSSLEAIIRKGGEIMDAQRDRRLSDEAWASHLQDADRAFGRQNGLIGSELRAGDVKERAEDAGTRVAGIGRAIANKLSSVIMLGERAEHTVLPGAAKAVELKAMMEREKANILEHEGGSRIVRDIASYERNYGERAMEDVSSVGFDASNNNVNLGHGANNDHLGKDATKGWQAKARLADMQRRFNALPREGQELLQRTAEFFKKIQNDISLQTIKNILHQAGIEESGLAERIHKDGLTDEDRAKFKTQGVVNALDEAREIKELKGWYIPFRRYGDHVVNAYHEVTAPRNGLKVSPDTIQFTDPKGSDEAARRMAEDFVAKHDLTHVGTESVWVDKNDATKILPGEDVNAVPAYRVKLQRQSTQFFESEAEAKRVQQHLSDNKSELGLDQVDGVRARADFTGRGSNALSGQMHNVMQALEKQDRFKNMSPAEQASVRQTINEAAVRVLGSTRLQASFQQRRNVLGFSNDLGRVTADYAKAATGYLAKLRFQPQLDEAFKELQQYTDAHKYESSDRTIKRDEFMNELRKRLYDEPTPTGNTPFGKFTRRMMQISSLDKLAGVSFHVINAQEPWTTSLPVIGGRHGFIAAGRALGHAYDLIGARTGIMAGLKDTVGAFSKDSGFTDYLRTFKSAINQSPAVGGAKAKRLGELLDYGDARGIFNDDAVHEVGRYADPTSNIAGRALDRADLMARQMGNAIEKINRTVTMISAYDLEYKKNGGNHEAAMHYAYEVTHDTMGDYSSWNSSPLFKSNTGMMMLQFKKFAHKTYYLLGKTLKGTIQGDAESAKQFAGLMVTHAAVAGALGLPLEPFKIALTAANLAGVTGFSYQDFEFMVREKAAEMLGAKGGEVFSHGLTRLLGIETSSRQGLDSLVTFASPSDPTRQKDVKAWLWDTFAGASGSLMLDWVKAAQQLSQGNFAKAAELAIPLKAASDVIKAGEGLSPTTDARGKTTYGGFNAAEAGAQALGFGPASKAENFEKRAQAANILKGRTDERTALISAWVKAKPADKSDAYRAAMDWSRTQPTGARIQAKDLVSAAAKAKKQAQDDGLRITGRNKDIAARVNAVYGNPAR